MHEVCTKAILSAKNGMNLYRGCTHGCIYCDSRSVCYHMEHPFEDVEVKINAPELLEDALRRKRHPCMIATGSMSDPYQPLEQTARLTRRCLEIVREHGFGITVLTKSDLVLRDLKLLQEINERTKCVVQMTLTTFDDTLCQILEPNVCPTSRRYEVLCALRDAGIPTVVWLSPTLPFLNDTEENLRGLLGYCADANVRGILDFGMGITLREGDREYFYQKLDEYFPGLKERYMRAFGESYECASPNAAALGRIFRAFCREHGMLWQTEEVFSYLRAFEEKSTEEQVRFF